MPPPRLVRPDPEQAAMQDSTTRRAEIDPLTPGEVDALKAFVGDTALRREILSVEMLRRFAATVGADLDVERRPPPLGHWAFFLDAADAAALGRDGHPAHGGFMPPVRLPRRMFAASTMRFMAPLACSCRRPAADDRKGRAPGRGVMTWITRGMWRAILDRSSTARSPRRSCMRLPPLPGRFGSSRSRLVPHCSPGSRHASCLRASRAGSRRYGATV